MEVHVFYTMEKTFHGAWSTTPTYRTEVSKCRAHRSAARTRRDTGSSAFSEIFGDPKKKRAHLPPRKKAI